MDEAFARWLVQNRSRSNKTLVEWLLVGVFCGVVLTTGWVWLNRSRLAHRVIKAEPGVHVVQTNEETNWMPVERFDGEPKALFDPSWSDQERAWLKASLGPIWYTRNSQMARHGLFVVDAPDAEHGPSVRYCHRIGAGLDGAVLVNTQAFEPKTDDAEPSRVWVPSLLGKQWLPAEYRGVFASLQATAGE